MSLRHTRHPPWPVAPPPSVCMKRWTGSQETNNIKEVKKTAKGEGSLGKICGKKEEVKGREVGKKREQRSKEESRAEKFI